ncbi:MAG: tyrosine-type recombinase/integrase [Caulobacterales bacterium]
MPETARLTKRVVEAVPTPPKGSQIELWDIDLGGLHVRVMPGGRRVYRFKYRAGGRQVIVTIGEHGTITAEQARERARALAGAVADGRDPITERKAAAEAAAEARRRAVTVNQLIDTYLEQGPLLDPAKRARSWEHDRSCLDAHVRVTLGKLLAASVRRGDVEGMVAAIVGGKTARVEKIGPRAKRVVRGGKAAARAALVALSTVYSWAEKRDLIAGNPCKGVKKPPAGKRETFLSDEQVDRLFATISDMERDGRIAPTFGDTVRLLALTGARRGEIEGLRWEEVDLQRGVAMLPAHRSKTGRKTIPLGAPALAILAQRRAVTGTSPFVFPSLTGGAGPANALSKNWLRVREAAGLPGVRLHDLRHTLASFLVAGGASLPMIGRVLGHSSAQTTQRYAHLQADPLRALVDAATARFGARPDAPAAPVLPLKRPGKP